MKTFTCCVCSALLVACSGPGPRAGATDGLVLGGDAGTSLPEAGAIVTTDAGGDASADAGSPLGAIAIVDEPDVPCVTRGGTSTVLYPATSAGLLSRLDRVGARRVAGDTDGFVIFDDTGANASATKVAVGAYATAFAPTSGAIDAVGTSFDRIEHRRYDPLGKEVGSAIVIATGTADVPGLAIASGPTASLAIWGDGRLYAAGVVSGGTAAMPVFPIGGPFHSLLSDAIRATTGDQFAIAWTTLGSGVFQSWFAIASPAGVVSGPTLVLSSASNHRIVRMATTPSGFLVAIDTEAASYVLPLLPYGNVAGPAHRYEGVRFTWDLASHGSGVGIVTSTADGHARFRPLDATGAAAGSWVCVDARVADEVALADDDAGYAAVIHTQPDGQTTYLRISASGAGP